MTHSARLLGFLLLLTARSFAAEANPPSYPPAPRGTVTDVYHGVPVADPYRWLEDLDSPETRRWVIAEAEVTEKYLKGIPSRKPLQQRLTALEDFEKFSLPVRRGGTYFQRYNPGLDPQAALYVSEGNQDPGRLLLDPRQLSTNGTAAFVDYVVSPDGRVVLYGVSTGGSDWTEWHARDVATGKDRPDVLRWTKYYRPVFSPDGRGVYYSAFPAPKPGEELSSRDLGNAVYYHAFGTDPASDPKIFERPDHPDWQYEPRGTPGSDWLVLTAGEGQVGDKAPMNVYAIPIGTGPGKAVMIVENFDAAYRYVGADHGLLYFQTSLQAPKGRVVALDPARPGRAEWKEIVPEQPDAMDFIFGSVSLVNHQLIVRTLHDVHTEVRIFDLQGRPQRSVALPGVGTAFGFSGLPDDSECFFGYTDWITPGTIYRLDLKTGTSSVHRQPKTRFDARGFESEQVFYKSKDGTRIPMFVIHQKGLKRDGTHPTLLYGYGGFAIPLLPRFDPTLIAWLERGGVYAVANIRGGGEYGEDWHRQGTGLKKQKGFDDFIAAAEWLIQERYTATPRLAITGASNGGLLVGACLTQRPDLFGAVVASVGVMDMLRFDQFGQGEGWTGDFGSPRDPQAFPVLRSYSPYHNVRPGTRYPATLIVTGDHDTRVMPAHSFKFAAALQAAQAGPAPILLRVQLSAGHGGGVTTQQQIEETADTYAFLFRSLGVE